jgi:drug/metabolite transporter (DMT)-like permease
VKTKPWFVYILAVLAMLFWGMSFVWSTIVFEYYDPITTVFLRLVLSTAILWIIIRIWKKKEKIRKEHYGLFLLSSLMNPFLYFIGENFGLKLTSPVISSVIIATIPLFTPVAGVLLLHEKLNKMNIAGIFFSFAGVLVMLVKPDMTMAAAPLGVSFLALAIVVAVGYSVMLKRLTEHYSAFTIIATQNFIGIWYFLPLFLILDFKKFIIVVPDQRLITSLLLLAVFASTLAFVFYTITTKHLGISRANIFTNLIPVFTAIFSFFMIAERLDLAKVVGMGLVLSGVALSQYKRKMSIAGAYRFIMFSRRNNGNRDV